MAKYVNASTGDNANDGSINNPWLDLEYALEGSRTARGETIYVFANDNIITNFYINKINAGQRIDINLSAGSGVTTIKPMDENIVIEIQIPINAGNPVIYNNGSNNILFEGFKFTNPNNITNILISTNGGGTTSLLDCQVDCNNALTSAGIFYINREIGANTLNIERVKIENIKKMGIYQRDAESAGFANTLNMKSCFMSGNMTGWEFLLYINADSNSYIKNCTFENKGSNSGAIALQGIRCDTEIKNNHYINSGTNLTTNFLTFNFSGLADSELYFRDNPNKLILTHNIVEAPNITGLPNTAISMLGLMNQHMIVFDHRNFYIDSGHINYKIPENSNACGRGDLSILPTKSLKIDNSGNIIRGGEDWNGNDIGCFRNGSPTYPIITQTKNQAILFGDSISENSSGVGTGLFFNSFSPTIKMVGTNSDNPGAIGGQGVHQLYWLIDWNAVHNPSEKAVIMIGANNAYLPTESNPAQLRDIDLVSQIVQIMKKCEYWGMTPYWMGLSSIRGNNTPPDNTRIININNLIALECENNGWKYEKTYSSQILNPDWKTDYYTDITTNVHPNNLGRKQLGWIANSLVNGFDFQGHLELQIKTNINNDMLPLGVFTRINILSCSNNAASLLYFQKETTGENNYTCLDAANSYCRIIQNLPDTGSIIKISLDWGIHSTGKKMRLTVNGVKSDLADFSGSFGSQDLRFFYGNTIHAGWIVKDSFKIFERPRW